MSEPEQVKEPPSEYIKDLMRSRGYTFTETVEDGERVERMYRPDGSLAVTARKAAEARDE